MDAGRIAEINKFARVIQDPAEMVPLSDAVEKMNPSCIIEIGVAHGGTLRMWYEIIRPGGKVIGIDNHEPYGEGSYPPDDQSGSGVGWDMNQLADNKKVHYVKGFSAEPEIIQKVSEFVEDGEADVLFIDADHGDIAVKKDYDNYMRFLRVGGMLIMCDMKAGNAPGDGPLLLWNKIKDTLDNTQVFMGSAGTAIGFKRRENE